MTWPDFLQALRPYGFRASSQEGYVAVRGLTEVAPELPYRVEWGLDGAPVRVFRGFLGSDLDRPTVFEGTPEVVLEWAEGTYPKMTEAA